MSSQDYPEPTEDPWEREYARYLEKRMEDQYWEEIEEQYNMQLSSEYEGEEVIVTGLNNSEMSVTIMNGEDYKNRALDPSEYNTLETEDSLPHKILHLPMGENDADAATVGEYLGLLLSTLWLEAEGFSGKRPFGNSDWQYVVYKALGKAGLVEITFDEDGYIDEFTTDEEYKADELILQAIRFAYQH